MRITVDIPDGLLERVMELGGYPTKRAAAIAALEECIRTRRESQAASEGPELVQGVSRRQPQTVRAQAAGHRRQEPALRPSRTPRRLRAT
jgi:hypothetical protein